MLVILLKIISKNFYFLRRILAVAAAHNIVIKGLETDAQSLRALFCGGIDADRAVSASLID
jgi:hypothetical protein